MYGIETAIKMCGIETSTELDYLPPLPSSINNRTTSRLHPTVSSDLYLSIATGQSIPLGPSPSASLDLYLSIATDDGGFILTPSKSLSLSGTFGIWSPVRESRWSPLCFTGDSFNRIRPSK
ncbi:hypothetical protein L2E82_48990 [Cichorium intybus]|uniref:Uncharacterized protein n=1 Tax=Cichorium intybus TaxID=13427 RepID=A0ACB8Z089_CICIN|nr:hypothetical protein L2E82_48990 [Cichorium intybus]